MLGTQICYFAGDLIMPILLALMGTAIDRDWWRGRYDCVRLVPRL